MEGYLASWGFLITKAGSIPTAVSALRPSKGVGKGPAPRPSGGAGIQAARPPVELCVPGRRETAGRALGHGLALITRPRPRSRFMRASHAWDVSGSKSSLSPRALSHVKSESDRPHVERRAGSPNPPALPGGWGAHMRGEGRQRPSVPPLTDADAGSAVTATFGARSWWERRLPFAQGHGRWDPGSKAGRAVTQPTLLAQVDLALGPEPTMAEQDCGQEAPGRREHTTTCIFSSH